MSTPERIAKAFVAAKREFSPALKTATNPHFRSKYADLAACLEAVNEALLRNDIAVIQTTDVDTAGVTVETVFLHTSGETLAGGKLHVPSGKQDPQGYGSALTYARRYSLMAACGIAAEDDDGNAAALQSKQQSAKAPEQSKDALPDDLTLKARELSEALGLNTDQKKQIWSWANGDLQKICNALEAKLKLK